MTGREKGWEKGAAMGSPKEPAGPVPSRERIVGGWVGDLEDGEGPTGSCWGPAGEGKRGPPGNVPPANIGGPLLIVPAEAVGGAIGPVAIGGDPKTPGRAVEDGRPGGIVWELGGPEGGAREGGTNGPPDGKGP